MPGIIQVRRVLLTPPPVVATGSWTQIWSNALDSDFGGGEYSLRNIVASSSLTGSGSLIRVTFSAPTNNSTTIDHASIVERSSGTVDGTTTPSELLFAGGHGVVIATGADAVSDQLSFTIDSSKDYLVIVDLNVGDAGIRYRNGTGDGCYLKASAASYNVQSPAGYSSSANSYVVAKIEVSP